MSTITETMQSAMDQLVDAEVLLQEALGEAIEGLSLAEAVALLVSQRENARNACSASMAECDALGEEIMGAENTSAATRERCDKLEAVLRVLLSPDTQIEWSHQVSVAIADGESLLKEVK